MFALLASSIALRGAYSRPITTIRRPLVDIVEGPTNGLLGTAGCSVCTALVSAVEAAMKQTKVQEEIEAEAVKVCGKFQQPYNALCQTVIKTYTPVIMSYLEQGLEKLQICGKLGLCSVKNDETNGNEIVCTICTTIVSAVEKAMTETKVETEVEDLVGQVCTKIQAPYSTLCVFAVKQYVPLMMSWLEEGLEKLEVCQKLKLCDAANEENKFSLTNAITCTMCKALIAEVEKAMVSTKVEDEVEKLVEGVCKKFPVPYSTLCDLAVKQFVPLIMDYLEKGFDHLEICQKIGMCSKTADAEENKLKLKDDAVCDLCMNLVALIEKEMVNTTVESEIEAFVIKYCPQLQQPYAALCEVAAGQFVPQIMKMLEQGLEHAEVCQRIKLCPNTTTKASHVRPISHKRSIKAHPIKAHQIAAPKSHIAKRAPATKGLKVKLGDPIVCEMCQDLVSTIEKEMESRTVEEEIEALIDEYCPKLKQPYSALCEVAVKQFVPAIMTLLEQGLEKLEICQKIGLCPNNTLSTKPVQVIKRPIHIHPIMKPRSLELAHIKKTTKVFPKQNGAITCEVCTSFLNWAEGEIDTISEKALWSLVENKCPSIPYLKGFCATITESEIQTLIKAIIGFIPNEAACTLIKLC